MKHEIAQAIADVIKKVFGIEAEVPLTRPDEQFGDYATNVALQLAGRLGKNSRDIAEAIAGVFQHPAVAKVDIAGPGFLNVSLTDEAVLELVEAAPAQHLTGQTVVAEYSDPNPFKVLHAGHLYTSVVGDAIANLLEKSGAEVHRVNFGGDVGLHVGKTLWAIIQALGGEHPKKLAEVTENERAQWMAEAYVRGTNTYENDEAARQEIVLLNKRVYQLHAENDHSSPLAQLYWTCRQWSYDYFDSFYEKIGTQFEKYYPESSVAELGLKTVRQQLEHGVFVESDGAVIFRGEEHGLHTRVFINKEGIPTYEAKDVGLIMAKWQDYHFDKSIIITGNEQEQYMTVVLKAIEQFAPELAAATTHLTHGIVKLQGGVKMSSRKGNILRAGDVIDAAATANTKQSGNSDQRVVLGAVKYAFLRQRLGGDIIYNPDESVSLQGNSGPYLQYAYVRARSILGKAGETPQEMSGGGLNDSERSLVRKLGQYAETMELAAQELMPHHICNYLYELAQEFNRFYEKNQVIGSDRQPLRLVLVAQYAAILEEGLAVLGIPAPEKM